MASTICMELHLLLSDCGLILHKFPFEQKALPQNGIYVLFQKNEFGHKTNRIVRIGTHTGKNQLQSRINQHFLIQNKDRSIFRKNIGRCLLNQSGDPYLEVWNIDFTTTRAKANLNNLRDFNKERELENIISKYIQENFSFYCLKIDEKEQRLYLEEKLIGTVSNCDQCLHSKNWLGSHSPKSEITKSGLWQVQGLYKEPLSRSDLSALRLIIENTIQWEAYKVK